MFFSDMRATSESNDERLSLVELGERYFDVDLAKVERGSEEGVRVADVGFRRPVDVSDDDGTRTDGRPDAPEGA